MANGLDEKRAVDFAKRVRELNQDGLGIRIFSGLECDIRRDGAMDLAEDALAELDIVVGKRAQPHESGSRRDDRSPAARVGVAQRSYPGASHRPHAAESRSRIPSISNASLRRLSAATFIWKSTAVRSGWTCRVRMMRTAKALGAKFAISTDCAPSQASRHQHAVRHHHGAARLAGSRRCAEHAAARKIRESDPKIMKVISSVEKYKNKLFSVSEEHAVDPGGFEIRRAIVHHDGSAVMMAVDDRKRILLVRQYRVPARKYLWELPAGKVDSGESPLQAAKRELKEETGYRARKWKKLVDVFSEPRLRCRKDDDLSGQGLDRRRSDSHGRRAHRDALVHSPRKLSTPFAAARSSTPRR